MYSTDETQGNAHVLRRFSNPFPRWTSRLLAAAKATLNVVLDVRQDLNRAVLNGVNATLRILRWVELRDKFETTPALRVAGPIAILVAVKELREIARVSVNKSAEPHSSLERLQLRGWKRSPIQCTRAEGARSGEAARRDFFLPAI